MIDYRWTYSGLLKEVETWKNVSGTLTQTIVRYTYDESGTGLLYIREVVGGTKTRFHWEGYDLYLEEVQSGSTWNSKYAYMNQPSRRWIPKLHAASILSNTPAMESSPPKPYPRQQHRGFGF